MVFIVRSLYPPRGGEGGGGGGGMNKPTTRETSNAKDPAA